ncbi:MAG: aspartate/glutamate racemase family protein, partial [Woeseiaceae bacterium]
MHITVINPNSNTVYTEQISSALDALRRNRETTIDCLTLEDAPLAIMTDDDVQSVVDPICRVVRDLNSSVAGVVIACFADPGLEEARALGTHPVVGCCEAAVGEARQHGTRIGLISTGDDVAADRDLMLSYDAGIERVVVQTLGIPTA